MRTCSAIPWLLLLAGGCGPVGPRYAKLDASKAKALDLVLVGGGSSFCATGDPPQLEAGVTTADGKRLETWSRGQRRDGTLEFDAFELSASLGVIDKEGVLRVGRDPFALLDRTIDVTAAVAGRPEISDSLRLTPTFDCGGVVNVSGDPGSGGYPGQAGVTGRVGQSGDSSRQATDGEPGGDGQDGGQGGPGQHAPAVEVALGYATSKTHGRLVVMRVDVPSRGGTAAHMLVNPRAGKRFVVVARGGAGGVGGSGGGGGAGGAGGSNNVDDGGNGGDGGRGGRGGDGGDGGDGGRVVVHYDARYPELQTMVAVVSAGGDGGAAGYGGSAGPAGTGGSSASGRAGTTGRAGVSGPPGVAGRQGRDGPQPSFTPVAAGELFSAELASGLPILH